MVTVIIICTSLIVLILAYGAYYKRKLNKQYQKHPYQQVTGSELEAELRLPQAQKIYYQRRSRVNLLVLALVAAVLVIGGLAGALIKWDAGAEQRQIAQAEKQRLEKLKKDEFSVWVDDNVSLFSDIAVRMRLERYKKEKLYELQSKLNELEAERAELTAKWTQNRENIDQIARDERDAIYDCYLKNFEEQQQEITSDMDKIRSMTIYDRQRSISSWLCIILLIWGVVTWIITFFLQMRHDALYVWVYWLSFFAAIVFLIVKLLFVGIVVGLIIAGDLLLFLVAGVAWSTLLKTDGV